MSVSVFEKIVVQMQMSFSKLQHSNTRFMPGDRDKKRIYQMEIKVQTSTTLEDVTS